MGNRRYTWSTAAVIRETNDAVTIIFDTKGEAFIYKPGQFVNLSLVINEQSVSRSYSLSSSADSDEKPAITVKAVEGGLMSNYILQHAEEIMEWGIEGPLGLFTLTGGRPMPEHLVLIAGGVGIAPLYSMLKYFLKHTRGRITLIYSNKTEQEIIFKPALDHLKQNFSKRFNVYYFLTRESTEKYGPEENCFTGRISSLTLIKLLKNGIAPEEETQYFICGPNGLVELSERVLDFLGVEKNKINKEYFTGTSINLSTLKLPDKMQEVLFHFWEQTNLLEVAPGRTILDSALEDRIGVPYSCKSGTCGQCAARLRSGKVHMAGNFVLPQALVDQGYVLLCQSYPLNNEVTIVVGE